MEAQPCSCSGAQKTAPAEEPVRLKKMKNVFVSRPTWIPTDFSSGLESFMALLDSYDLKPRTLGVSDYPIDSPLDEVISILNKCVGAIILGYPQIRIEKEKGQLKNTEIDPNSNFSLATEWNHIEAGLAYAKKIPLLVIHHVGVSRGIFDRGAINKFIYEIDLSNPSWFSDKTILGAISAWKKKLPDSPSEIEEPKAKVTLIFDPSYGTLFSSKTGLRYCQKCYHSSPKNIVELREFEGGCSCSVCGTHYRNPNWNPPTQAITDFDLFDD